MMKCAQIMALLLGFLSVAGCANVKTPPQPQPPVVAQAPEQAPEPNAPPEQTPPPTTVPEPNEARPPVIATPEKTDAPVGIDDKATGGEEARPVGWATPTIPGPAPVGSVGTAHPTDLPKAVEDGKNSVVSERERIDANAPAPVKVSEPNNVKAAEPNHVAPPPAEPNETLHQASDVPALARFYAQYAQVLQTYVRDDGLVDYAALDRHKLDLKTLLLELDELDPNAQRDWSREQKLAFWLNAYNLKVLEIITRNYPIQSSWWLRLTWPPSDIRHIKGIWTDYKFIVMDEEFTLAEVEQRFFRKTFDDPRIYLALAYAARSGPPLRRTPYRSAGLDRQLDEQVRRFLTSPQGLQLDRRNLVVRLSALFKPAWRGKEFLRRFGTDKKFKDREPQTRAVLNFLSGYLSREDVYFLEVENYTLEYLNFDWRLNDPAADY